MHVFITSAFIKSQYTLRSGAYQRTGWPTHTHTGTNIPILPAHWDTGGENHLVHPPRRWWTMHRFSQSDNKLFFWLCGHARRHKAGRTRSDLETNSSANTKPQWKFRGSRHPPPRSPWDLLSLPRVGLFSCSYAVRPEEANKWKSSFAKPYFENCKQISIKQGAILVCV